MLKPITAAGGLVFRFSNQGHLQVLLILRNGVWDIPKGKLEANESIPMCAVREVAEETSAELPMIVKDLGTTYHEYSQKGVEYGKTTYWYAMILPRPGILIPQTNEGIEQIDWVEIGKARDEVGYQNLVDIIDRFNSWIGL
jgi:8-oxo-dGTP pyrophosphatase MutT (NUDIX family)